jgi:hypothetical protein
MQSGYEKQFIPRSQLVHGAYYAGTCRNAIEQRFYHLRHKFGFKFVEAIQAPEDDDRCDVFYATSVMSRKMIFRLKHDRCQFAERWQVGKSGSERGRAIARA